jgi:hypothetical protein
MILESHFRVQELLETQKPFCSPPQSIYIFTKSEAGIAFSDTCVLFAIKLYGKLEKSLMERMLRMTHLTNRDR